MGSACMQCMFSASVTAIFIFQIKRTITAKTLAQTRKNRRKNCALKLHTYWSHIITIMLCYEHQSVLLLACAMHCALIQTQKNDALILTHTNTHPSTFILLLCPFFGNTFRFSTVIQKCQWIQKTNTNKTHAKNDFAISNNNSSTATWRKKKRNVNAVKNSNWNWHICVHRGQRWNSLHLHSTTRLSFMRFIVVVRCSFFLFHSHHSTRRLVLMRPDVYSTHTCRPIYLMFTFVPNKHTYRRASKHLPMHFGEMVIERTRLMAGHWPKQSKYKQAHLGCCVRVRLDAFSMFWFCCIHFRSLIAIAFACLAASRQTMPCISV